MRMVAIWILVAILCSPGLAQQQDSITAKSGTQLQAVTVKAQSQLVRQQADRIIYDLQADPQSKMSSVLDMMRKVPYLSVDGEDNVLLKGSRSYKVYINGRPWGLAEGNMKEVLRSMPASTIKSIEVITSPPAKYDAEGLAGIINIVTYRQAYNGYKGSANVYEKDPAGGPGAGGSFTGRRGRVGIVAMAGMSQYRIPETNGTLTRTDTGMMAASLHQYSRDRTQNQVAYSGLEASYEPDSLNLISGAFNWNDGKMAGQFSQVSTLTGAGHLQQYRLEGDNKSKESGLDATINYQRGFKANKDQMLTFSYRYLSSGKSMHTDIKLSDEINYALPDYRQGNMESRAEHTAQADYVQPLKHQTIECGVKGIWRDNRSDFEQQNLNAVTSEYETDPARSNVFNSRQDVLAVYGSYSIEAGNWQVKAGVRAEQTIVEIEQSQSVVQQQVKYLNVLPNVVMSRKLKGNSNLCFSYVNRMQRPSVAELNPFTDRSNPNMISQGNPYLRPITSDVCQLSYMKQARATWNISIGCMYFKNGINAVPVYDPVTQVTTSRYENYATCRVLKTNISLNYPVTSAWNVAMNADIRHVTVYGIADGNRFTNAGFGVYVNGSGGYNFDKGWRVNADLTYKMGGILLPMGRSNGFAASSFSVNKGIAGSKLTVSAAVSNPFTKYRYNKETIDGANFLQTSSRQVYYRRFTVSINYRFGKLQEKIRKNRRGINNDDVSEGS